MPNLPSQSPRPTPGAAGPPSPGGSRARGRAFTLVEMLVVMAIIVTLVALVTPLVDTHSQDVNKAVYDIQGALELARTYALANHTYTWVGFFEEDVTKPSTNPATSGVGRVVISIVASRDGTSIYDPIAVSQGTATSPVLPPASLVQVGAVTKLPNIHMFIPASSSDTFGQRPGNHLPSNIDRVGLSDAGTPLIFQFQYPLGGSAQYTFGIHPAPQQNGFAVPSAVVQFNPQGEMISDAGPVPGVAPCQEIAIEATHGNVPASNPNVAAIDIAGLTGETTIYRR